MIWLILIGLAVGVAVLFSSALAPIDQPDNYNFSDTLINSVEVKYIYNKYLFFEQGCVCVVLHLNKTASGKVMAGYIVQDDSRNILKLHHHITFSDANTVNINVSLDFPFAVVVFDDSGGYYDAVVIDKLGSYTPKHVTIDEVEREPSPLSKLIEQVLNGLTPVANTLIAIMCFVLALLPYTAVLISIWLLIPLANADFDTFADRLISLIEFVIGIFISIIGLIRKLLPL